MPCAFPRPRVLTCSTRRRRWGSLGWWRGTAACPRSCRAAPLEETAGQLHEAAQKLGAPGAPGLSAAPLTPLRCPGPGGAVRAAAWPARRHLAREYAAGQCHHNGLAAQLQQGWQLPWTDTPVVHCGRHWETGPPGGIPPGGVLRGRKRLGRRLGSRRSRGRGF